MHSTFHGTIPQSLPLCIRRFAVRGFFAELLCPFRRSYRRRTWRLRLPTPTSISRAHSISCILHILLQAPRFVTILSKCRIHEKELPEYEGVYTRTSDSLWSRQKHVFICRSPDFRILSNATNRNRYVIFIPPRFYAVVLTFFS